MTRTRALIAVLLAVFGAGIFVTVDSTDDGHGHRSTSVKVGVDRSGQPGVQPATITVPKAAVQQAAPTLEKQLRDETPPLAEQVAPGELTAAQQEAARIKATQPPLPTAGATAGYIGCRTQFVGNQSSRHGVRPQLQVLHYTVSPNRLGWSDVNAVVALFDRTASQASSNFVIDSEGNCAYIVPIEAKAWTQAAANPFSVSFEIIDMGNESVYLQPAGYAKLRSVMQQVSQRTGIPLRSGAVNGCTPTRSGIVQHKDFGICGGGHHDIAPFALAPVVKIVSAHQRTPKKVLWIRHRRAVHLQYLARCPRGHGGTAECASLRARARKLDNLIARR